MFKKINHIIKIRRDIKAVEANIQEMKAMREAHGANNPTIDRNIEVLENTIEKIKDRARANTAIFGISFI